MSTEEIAPTGQSRVEGRKTSWLSLIARAKEPLGPHLQRGTYPWVEPPNATVTRSTTGVLKDLYDCG